MRRVIRKDVAVQLGLGVPCLVKARPGVRAERMTAAVKEYLSKLFLIDDFLHADVLVVDTHLITEGEGDVILFDCRNHAICLLEVERHRLVADDGLSCRCCLFYQLTVVNRLG